MAGRTAGHHPLNRYAITGGALQHVLIKGRFVPSRRVRTLVGLCANALENQGAAPKLLVVTGSLSPVSVIIRR